jgi:hypothetical protein
VKRKVLIATLTVFTLAAAGSRCLVLAAAQAKKAEPLTGTWKCIGKIPDRPDGEFQLDLEQNGEEVKGSGSNAQGSAPLKGTVKDGKFKLSVEAGDVTYTFDGELSGDKIKGKFAVPVASIEGTFEGSREGATAAAPASKAPAKAAASLTGTWTVTLKIPERPEGEGQLDLEQTGEEVKGTGSNAQGSAPIKGTAKDGKFKFTVETGQANWEFEGKLDGDKISGEFSIPAAGVKGTFEGAKKKS